jgi:DNA-binding transcriptional ArsR family regulator
MPNFHASLDGAFHALSDPTRRAIVAQLSKRPQTVGELSRPFPVALPTLLQHIRVLEQSGLVSTEKRGRVRTCALRREGLEVTEAWLAEQRRVWEARLDQLDAYVASIHEENERNGRK